MPPIKKFNGEKKSFNTGILCLNKLRRVYKKSLLRLKNIYMSCRQTICLLETHSNLLYLQIIFSYRFSDKKQLATEDMKRVI